MPGRYLLPYAASFALALFASAVLVRASVPAARSATGEDPWPAAARAWESTARRLESLGDTIGMLSAWREAALSWERSAEGRAVTSVRPRGGDAGELEEKIQRARAEREEWERAALSWGLTARARARVGDAAGQAEAEGRSQAALAEIRRLEGEIADIERRLAQIRETFLGREVSPSLALELAERWARAAREWVRTAETWRRGGETVPAARAEREAEKLRDRIRSVAPGLSEEWIIARTYLRDETVPISRPAPTTDYVVRIPDVPSAPSLPPRWRLTDEERSALLAAEGWREVARSWALSAQARAAENKVTEAEAAVRKQVQAAARALDLELGVRRAYAERESLLSGMLVSVLAPGETAPSPEQILAALDAETGLPPPPVLAGVPRTLAPPPLPAGVTEETEGQGLFDLRFGGPIPSSLSVRGRKLVQVNYSLTKFKKESPNRPGGNTQTSLDITQELSVDVLGMVGRADNDHLNVNIHFDDSQRGVNEVNNRTILVDFDGARHQRSFGAYEINGAFGEIALTLPGTEFAVYNKSLFGVRGDLNLYDLNLFGRKVERVTVLGIASQTKGQSASRLFQVSGARTIQDIPDINFIRRRFYRTEPDATILPITGVTVYRDDQNGSNNQGTISFTAGSSPAGFFHAGNWNILAEGIDYTIRLSDGLLEMRSTVGENDVLSVAYTAANGTSYGIGKPNPPRLLKVSTDTTSAALDFFRSRHELRNRYILVTGPIRRDDPERVVEIRDLLGSPFPPNSTQTYLSLFGFDANNDNKVDEERIDFDFGFLIGADTDPFTVAGSALSNNLLYTKESPGSNEKIYTIHSEVSSSQPSEVYVLGQPVLANSDIVSVDGVKAVRNADYFIDYEVGVITFINKSLIREGGTIRVDYEFLPFGAKFERTLAGARLEVVPRTGYLFGTTAIFDFSPEISEAPRIFEGAPDRLAIVDVNFSGDLTPAARWIFKRGSNWLARGVREKFNLSFATELAYSRREPNTFGAAIIEDFEATEEQVSLSMTRTAWQIASRPEGLPLSGETGPNDFGGRGSFALENVDNFGHTPVTQVEEGDVQRSLRMDLAFAPGDTWIAIRQPISSTGTDLSDVSVVEVYLKGAEGIGVYLDAGIVSEDADGDGTLDSEDVGLDGTPSTADAGENNGVLNTGEDVGYVYNDGVNAVSRFGGGNGVLDAEDMDGDFILDERKDFFRFGDLNTDTRVERVTVAGSDGTNWRLYRFSFKNGRASSLDADSKVVKHIRLFFTRADGPDTAITVYSDLIQFRRSIFKGSDSVTLIPRNSVDDPATYDIPSEVRELRGSDASGKEQSLAFQWNLPAGESAVITRTFVRRADIADYNRLSFYLAGDARGESVTLRLKTDANNYFEIEVRDDFGANPPTPKTNAAHWRRYDVSIKQLKEIAIGAFLAGGDTVQAVPGTGQVIRVVGLFRQGQSPSLSNLNIIEFAITNGSAAADSGEFWIDDVFVKDPEEQRGQASKAEMALGWADLWSLSGGWRNIDGNFRGVGFINNPIASTYDQADVVSRSIGGSFNVTRLLPASWRLSLPLSFGWSENTTELDPERIEVALKSSLGITKSIGRNISTTLSWRDFPAIAMALSQSRTSVDLRNEDRQSLAQTFTASTGWGKSWSGRFFFIPIGQSLSLSVSYGFTENRSRAQNFSVAIPDQFSNDRNQNVSVANTWRPVSFLTLNYSMSQSIRNRVTQTPSDRFDGIAGRSQRFRADLPLPARFGLSPNLSWGGSYNENFYNRTVGEKRKDVALAADFHFSTGLDFAAWLKLLSFMSMRYDFGIQSSASYRDLEPSNPFSTTFHDYVRLKSLPIATGNVNYAPTGLVPNRTTATTYTSHSWSGGIRTFPWLSTSYTTGLVRSEAASGGGPAINDAFNANLAFSMDYNQAFPNAWPHFRSAVFSLNLPYNWSENAAARAISFSPSLSGNMQVSEALNTTFGLSYGRSSNRPLLTGDKSVSTNLSPSLSFTYDLGRGTAGRALVVPIVGRRIEVYRRVQLSGGTTANFRKARLGPKDTSDQRDYGLNLSLGYQIATGLQLTGGISGSYLDDRLEELQSKYGLGGSARLEWQF